MFCIHCKHWDSDTTQDTFYLCIRESPAHTTIQWLVWIRLNIWHRERDTWMCFEVKSGVVIPWLIPGGWVFGHISATDEHQVLDALAPAVQELPDPMSAGLPPHILDYHLIWALGISHNELVIERIMPCFLFPNTAIHPHSFVTQTCLPNKYMHIISGLQFIHMQPGWVFSNWNEKVKDVLFGLTSFCSLIKLSKGMLWVCMLMSVNWKQFLHLSSNRHIYSLMHSVGGKHIDHKVCESEHERSLN